MENTTKICPINFTKGAIEEILSIIKDTNEQNPLRIGVENGGCSGFNYILNFEEKKDTDYIYSIEKIKLIINPLHLIHINDLEIDFEQDLNSRGFTYNNPNAKTTCGCGTSFS